MSLLSATRRSMLQPSSRPFLVRHVPRLTRLASTQPAEAAKPTAAAKQPSSMAAFYKEFTRPFLKVFLGALFTYQVLYWSWEKLRTDEIREEKTMEVEQLEARVEELKAAKGKPK